MKKFTFRHAFITQIAIGFYWSTGPHYTTFQVMLPFYQLGFTWTVDIEEINPVRSIGTK